MASVYTPEMLAEEWGCSHQHVRKLIRDGHLRAFRLGEKLLRIPADAIEEYQCRNVVSPASEEDGPPHGPKTMDAGAAIRLVRRIARKPSAS